MPPSIGPQLRSAREKRGLSLLDAAHLTRIPAQRLMHLEQDDFASFGSLTYARSFLRVYSTFLGVDAQAMLEELPSGRLGGSRDYRYLTDNHGPWVLPRGNRLAKLSQQARRHPTRSPVTAGIAIFVLMLVGTGIWGSHVAQEKALLTTPPETAPTPSVVPAVVSHNQSAPNQQAILKVFPPNSKQLADQSGNLPPLR